MALHPFVNTAVTAARKAGTVIMQALDRPDKINISKKAIKTSSPISITLPKEPLLTSYIPLIRPMVFWAKKADRRARVPINGLSIPSMARLILFMGYRIFVFQSH